MIPLTLKEIAFATNGVIVNQKSDSLRIDSVSTDSRVINNNCLFIALQGDNFDAHDFAQQVKESGAVALLVHKNINVDIPYVLIEDTRIGLGLLAAFVKQKINGLKCAAITGSNGKTTTKELLSQILGEFCHSQCDVLSTAGNFNNDIGLPLTLLRLTEKTQFAVVELGANHQGEIAYTSQLAQPDVALINNIMPAHLEGFGSLEGVAKAKGEIWSSLGEDGYAVVNLDANFAKDYLKQLELLKVNVLTFSQHDPSASLYGSDFSFNETGNATFILTVNMNSVKQKVEIQLNLPGKHNVSNALAAASMAIALGCQLDVIERGLNQAKSVSGRVNSSKVNELVTVIDDTYNANSASVKAAIDVLAQYKSKHLLILGDMGELGKYSLQEHVDIGEYAAEKNIEGLLTVGVLTENTASAFNKKSNNEAQHFVDKQDLKDQLSSALLKNNEPLTILVKGSRSAKMEEVVAYIKQI